jgi:putative DNA primase/helicase
LIADGKIHRCPTEGKLREKDGAYCLYLKGAFPAGWFQNWRRGEAAITWRAYERDAVDGQTWLAHEADMKHLREEREAEERKLRADVSALAGKDWESALPAKSHGYLDKKGVAINGARTLGDRLLVPMYSDETGHLVNLQSINAEGQKRFMKGGQAAGCHYLIGEKLAAPCFCVAEGFATAASVHEATGYPAVVAFAAKDLPAAAIWAQNSYPHAQIMICGDDDWKSDQNPGRRHAEAAAQAAKAALIFPDFGDGREEAWTDFNDLARARGNDEVARQINAALAARRDGAFPAPKTGAAGNREAWPEPGPLPDGLEPVAPFDFDLIPEKLRPWAEDIANTMQSPADFVGVGIMTGLGAVIGRKAGIRPQEHTGWTETANQWGLVIGRPGVLKSPTLEAVMAPLNALSARAFEEFKKKAAQRQQAAEIAKHRAKLREQQIKKTLEEKPKGNLAELLAGLPLPELEEELVTLRRYVTNDATPAALGALFLENPNGLLVFRDEIVSLLLSLDREENAEGRGFYLTGWGGRSPYTIDRIGRGQHLHIPAVCLSVLGSTQPGKIARYLSCAVRGGEGDDGLIQRFGLMVWPDIGSGWKDMDRPLKAEAKRAAFNVYQALDALEPTQTGAQQDESFEGEPKDIPYFRFDAEALEIFREWRGNHERRLRSGELHPALEAHLAKYRKLVPAISLTCHLADGAHGGVGKPAILRALAWASYLETHARRAYASVTMPEADTAKAIVAKIKSGALPDAFPGWKVWRPGWSRLTDRHEVQKGLDLLADLDWLKADVEKTTGRPKTTYLVNPKVRS